MHRFLLISLMLCVASQGQSQTGPSASANSDQASQSPQSNDSTAQVSNEAQDQSETTAEDKTSMFSTHLLANRYWISGQANFIFQAHGPFHSPYQGTNSFVGYGETANSRVLTLYTGVKLPGRTEILFDLEETGGGGLSQALGLAGFTNLDVVRNPELGQGIYIARMMFHETIALTPDTVDNKPNPFNLQGSIPSKRIELRAGKMSLVDFFDINGVGSDSHLQFTNWTIDNNGAYDYAADTRGYTFAAIVEYQSQKFGVRFGEALMPTVANGIDLEWNLTQARAENLEFEFRPSWFKGLATYIRPLAYLNHGNMGSYSQAINAYQQGVTPTPDVTLYRHPDTLKQGFGLNLEQELPAHMRVYFRGGWNEGKHESFCYTEVNDTVSAGIAIEGDGWNRKNDKVGAAVVSNGLSTDHRNYLADGGLGFLLGDGRLSYGREFISESFYNAQIWRGLYGAAQISVIVNPGYNRARGPAVVPGLRLHIDF
jgi:high affinity Mn2+ porin